MNTIDGLTDWLEIIINILRFIDETCLSWSYLRIRDDKTYGKACD